MKMMLPRERRPLLRPRQPIPRLHPLRQLHNLNSSNLKVHFGSFLENFSHRFPVTTKCSSLLGPCPHSVLQASIFVSSQSLICLHPAGTHFAESYWFNGIAAVQRVKTSASLRGSGYREREFFFQARSFFSPRRCNGRLCGR